MGCSSRTITAAMVACLGCGEGAPRSSSAPQGPTRPASPETPLVPARASDPVGRDVLAAATAHRQAAPAPADPAKERLLIDVGDDKAARAEHPRDEVRDALVRAFPDPHAAGKPCDPNRPGTPPGQRAGGVLLPNVTQVAGAFTRPGAKELAFLIDYCMTGAGAPRTRRLLVLAAGVATFDRELPAAEPFDEVLGAADLDGDGRAELLLTTSIYQDARIMVDLAAVSLGGGALTTLGTWRAIVHCGPSDPTRTTLALHVRVERGAPIFRDEVTTTRCIYPPPPPSR